MKKFSIQAVEANFLRGCAIQEQEFVSTINTCDEILYTSVVSAQKTSRLLQLLGLFSVCCIVSLILLPVLFAVVGFYKYTWVIWVTPIVVSVLVISLAGLFFACTVRSFRQIHNAYRVAQDEVQQFLQDENAHKYYKRGVHINAKYETRYTVTKDGGTSHSLISSSLLKPVPYLIVYSNSESSSESEIPIAMAMPEEQMEGFPLRLLAKQNANPVSSPSYKCDNADSRNVDYGSLRNGVIRAPNLYYQSKMCEMF